MSISFQITAGSVAGREHRDGIPQNNQDAWAIVCRPGVCVAVVADGCGDRSASHSEIGAGIAVKVVSYFLKSRLAAGEPLNAKLLDRTRQHLLNTLYMSAVQMGNSLSNEITESFLFTLNGVIITDEKALFFLIGDGVSAANGEIDVFDSGKNNTPIYPAYELTGSPLTDGNPEALKFRIIREMPTADLDSWLIATDGCAELIKRQDDCLPGKTEPIGPLSQFWTQDRYFTRTGLTRRLNLIAGDQVRADTDGRFITDPGKLKDDTTLVVGRRSPRPSEG